jgi:hypothetical protein
MLRPRTSYPHAGHLTMWTSDDTRICEKLPNPSDYCCNWKNQKQKTQNKTQKTTYLLKKKSFKPILRLQLIHYRDYFNQFRDNNYFAKQSSEKACLVFLLCWIKNLLLDSNPPWTSKTNRIGRRLNKFTPLRNWDSNTLNIAKTDI